LIPQNSKENNSSHSDNKLQDDWDEPVPIGALNGLRHMKRCIPRHIARIAKRHPTASVIGNHRTPAHSNLACLAPQHKAC